MTVHRLIETAAFDPETVVIMGHAYEAARAKVGMRQPLAVLETIAKRILDAAHRGERDPEKLTALALRGLDGTGDSR